MPDCFGAQCSLATARRQQFKEKVGWVCVGSKVIFLALFLTLEV